MQLFFFLYASFFRSRFLHVSNMAGFQGSMPSNRANNAPQEGQPNHPVGFNAQCAAPYNRAYNATIPCEAGATDPYSRGDRDDDRSFCHRTIRMIGRPQNFAMQAEENAFNDRTWPRRRANADTVPPKSSSR